MNNKEEKTTDINVIQIKDENGKLIDCTKLFTFDSPETGKSYIVYTDNTKDESGSLRVYANIYNANNTNKELLPIETEEEWNTVEAILSKLEEQSKKDNK